MNAPNHSVTLFFFLHTSKTLFESINPFMSYHPEIVISPSSKKGTLLCKRFVECDRIQVRHSFHGYIHMCQILLGSINPFMSYHQDIVYFPKF